MIETSSVDQRRSAFEILIIEEFGTSRRTQNSSSTSNIDRKSLLPNLGDLIALLVKAELYRAADFVAEKFLLEPRPARPIKGKINLFRFY